MVNINNNNSSNNYDYLDEDDFYYDDEPLEASSDDFSLSLPEPLREARAMEEGSNYEICDKIFLEQAIFLADYEDDFVYEKRIVRYYPTYESLSDKELRAYFTWRTKWKNGDKQEGSICFAFIYTYELLKLVGCTDATDAFRKLNALMHDYAEFFSKIRMYLKPWLIDFVAYYDLDPALLLETGIDEIRWDKALDVLSKAQMLDDSEIFQAVLELSGAVLQKSRFYKQYPKMVEKVVAGIIRQIDAHYAKNCQKTWIDSYFGSIWRSPTEFFDRAVFFDREPQNSGQKILSSSRYYKRYYGIWTTYSRDYNSSARKKFLDILRTVDALLRDATDFPYPTQPKVKTKWIIAAINEEIQKWYEAEEKAKAEAEKARMERMRLSLDLSRLGNIRSDSTETRDKLLTEEEIAETSSENAKTIAEEPEKSEKSETAENPGFSSLSPQERRYLRCLLEGTPTNWLASEGLLPSLICDSINEKLYDIFSDTVLENGELVEDYKDEIKDNI